MLSDQFADLLNHLGVIASDVVFLRRIVQQVIQLGRLMFDPLLATITKKHTVTLRAFISRQ